MAGMTREQRREKADRTTGAAVEIIRKEQEASVAKTERLRALRAERDKAPAALGESGIGRRRRASQLE